MKNIYSLLFCFMYSLITSANVGVLNGFTHVASGKAGDVIHGEIILVNSSLKEERVTFSMADAIYNCGSNTYYTMERTHDFSSINWVQGEVAEKVLLPNEKYVFKYSIIVPKKELASGSYWSMIMVNVEKPIKEEMVREQVSVKSKIRYGIRLITDINEKSDQEIEFEGVSTSLADQDNSVTISVGNYGMFAEKVSLTLEIYNQKGEKIKELYSVNSFVFPRVCKDFTFSLNHLLKGNYDCVLLAETRGDLIGTNMSISVD